MTTSSTIFEAAGLNLAVVLDRVGGDTGLLREITQIFLEEYPALMGEVRAAVKEANSTRLERAAHSLKGSVSNFGADSVTSAAYALEVIGRTRQMESAPDALVRLETGFRQLHPALLAIANGQG